MTRRPPLALACLLVALAPSCAGSPPEARTGRTDAPADAGLRLASAGPIALGAPRWALPERRDWVERTAEGLDHLVVGNRRVEARGAEVLGTAASPGDIDGAAAAPPWSMKEGAPARYVLWHERDVYGAAEWLGEARKLGRLPAPVLATFDWLDGTGLSTAAGAFVVRPSGGAPDKLALPGVTAALAADARRALVLTAFGHARLTLDAGKSFSDVSAALPEATELEVRGDELHVLLRGEARRAIDARGAITPVETPKGTSRHEFPKDLDDRWPEDAVSSALEMVGQHGLLLPDGDAMTTLDATCARIDLRSGRATAIFALEAQSTRETSCEPFRAKEGPLLLCESEGHARVLDVTSGGRIERSFDLPAGKRFDRFVGVDGEALGFVGPCEGDAPPSPADVVAGASPTNGSNQRSAVFCARKSPGAWVEHALEPADASDVVAWIPRPDGGAVALVAVPGTFLDGAPRVSVRGALRVVRVARNEPPLDIGTYGWESSMLLSRAMRAAPDGTLEGWVTSAHVPSGLAAMTIDPEGHARQFALPARASRLVSAGRFALVSTEENRLFETTDYGKTYRPVALPPSGPSNAEPLSCSEVGCRVGAFVRIGWGAPEGDAGAAEGTPTNPEVQRPMPAPPLVRLACRFAGPGETKRLADSFGVGFTQAVVPRMAPGRIGFTGAILTPWSGGPQTAISGDAEVAFVPLFDLAAPVLRATVPLSRLGPTPFHPFETHLGYLLDGQTVRPLVTSSYGRCAAPLVDDAGFTVPTGGCADDPTIGVVLGRRALLVSRSYGREIVSSLELAAGLGKAAVPGKAALPNARRELSSRRLPEHASEMLVGVGERRRAPVAVALDASGGAVLVPIDPERGQAGDEELVAPLSGLLSAKDPRCAPSPDDARVALAFDTEIGLVEGSLPGVSATGTAGLAVIRFSRARACLEAVEIAVRDERHEADLGYYDPPGTVRLLIAKLDGKDAGKGTLVVLGFGSEVRQPLVCDGVAP